MTTEEKIARFNDRVIRHDSQFYIDKLFRDEPFSLSRYGDGEVACMFSDDERKKNCDGAHYTFKLGQALVNTLKNGQDYYHCTLRCTFNCKAEDFLKFVEDICPDIKWYAGEHWQKLSADKKIGSLISAIVDKKYCFVGPEHLRRLKTMRGFERFDIITVPSIDAYSSTGSTMLKIAEKIREGVEVFCFSAGFATNVWIDELYRDVGDKCFLIDFGSLWDPYCGVLSRSGYRKAGHEFFDYIR